MKVRVFQRLQATESRMLRMICRVILKDKVEYSDCIKSGGKRFREAFQTEKIEVVQTYCN